VGGYKDIIELIKGLIKQDLNDVLKILNINNISVEKVSKKRYFRAKN
jgi:type III secretory pathway lipoprotein EscJ